MTEETFLSRITIGDLYDIAIISHGFASYKRDYVFRFEASWKSPHAGTYLLTFRHCYEMSYEIVCDSETLIQSWDDVFIDFENYENAGSPNGYVWGTNGILAYPGFSLAPESEKAKTWSQKLEKPMQEVQLLAEIIKMNLVFFDWSIKKVADNTF